MRCPALFEDGGGWPQGSHQELGLTVVLGFFLVVKILKCHFHNISVGRGGLGPPFACLSFFQISGEDWEIKWELRISIPALRKGQA
jgi:hypothetical protein